MAYKNTLMTNNNNYDDDNTDDGVFAYILVESKRKGEKSNHSEYLKVG